MNTFRTFRIRLVGRFGRPLRDQAGRPLPVRAIEFVSAVNGYWSSDAVVAARHSGAGLVYARAIRLDHERMRGDKVIDVTAKHLRSSRFRDIAATIVDWAVRPDLLAGRGSGSVALTAAPGNWDHDSVQAARSHDHRPDAAANGHVRAGRHRGGGRRQARRGRGDRGQETCKRATSSGWDGLRLFGSIAPRRRFLSASRLLPTCAGPRSSARLSGRRAGQVRDPTRPSAPREGIDGPGEPEGGRSSCRMRLAAVRSRQRRAVARQGASFG